MLLLDYNLRLIFLLLPFKNSLYFDYKTSLLYLNFTKTLILILKKYVSPSTANSNYCNEDHL